MEATSKVKWCLVGGLAALLLLVASSIFVPEAVVSAVEWLASNRLTHRIKGLSPGDVPPEETLVEMVVERVGISAANYQPVVVLKEKYGEVYLPIWIGAQEANAISVVIEGIRPSRPLTADLLLSILDRVGGSIAYIAVNDLRDHTYYANVIVNSEWQQLEIDARPSDAIALAVRVGAPIYAHRQVLDRAGIVPRKADKPIIMNLENRLIVP